MTSLKVNAEGFGTLALDGEKFYFRCRSFVDIKTGQPLAAFERRQQKVVIATRDTNLYKSIEKSSALHVKADELRAQILAWETAAANGYKVTSDGTVVEPVTPLIVPTSDIMVTAFFNDVFLPAKRELVKTGQYAAITLETYQRYWKMFLARFFNGTRTFKNFTAADGRHFLQNLRKDDGTPYGENTVKKIHSTCSGIWTEAVEAGYCDSGNVWRDVKRTKAPRVSAEQGTAYTEEQVVSIIQNLDNEVTGGRRDHSVRAAQIVLALGFWAGLRPSEIIALRWENVDVDAGRLKVCESIVNGVHAKRTKTDEDRVVTYLAPLVPTLRKWKRRNADPTTGQTTGLVVSGYYGNAVKLSQLSDQIIYPNCKKNGLGDLWKGTAWYGLRRGCGTLLVKKGCSIEQGAKFLGNTTAVFEENYWVDNGEASAQAAEIYRRSTLVEVEHQQRKQLTAGLVDLGLAEVEGRLQ